MSKVEIDKQFIAQIVIIAVLALFLVFNIGKLVSTGNVSTSVESASAGVIPQGQPKVYGEELGVSYSDVRPSDPQLADATIAKLANIDKSETLSGENKQRYIDIASQISCEYCCGAKSIIFSDGRPACGCAHSYAMRGLAKYLVKNHGDGFSDKEILAELGKWKVLFFPGIHKDKAKVLEEKGIDTNYVNLASNKYRGIEKGQTSGGMVGGC